MDPSSVIHALPFTTVKVPIAGVHAPCCCPWLGGWGWASSLSRGLSLNSWVRDHGPTTPRQSPCLPHPDCHLAVVLRVYRCLSETLSCQGVCTGRGRGTPCSQYRQTPRGVWEKEARSSSSRASRAGASLRRELWEGTFIGCLSCTCHHWALCVCHHLQSFQ